MERAAASSQRTDRSHVDSALLVAKDFGLRRPAGVRRAGDPSTPLACARSAQDDMGGVACAHSARDDMGPHPRQRPSGRHGAAAGTVPFGSTRQRPQHRPTRGDVIAPVALCPRPIRLPLCARRIRRRRRGGLWTPGQSHGHPRHRCQCQSDRRRSASRGGLPHAPCGTDRPRRAPAAR